MLRPSLTDLQKNKESYYSVVVGIAKRARQIAEEAQAEKELLTDKPVDLAVNEFDRGEFRIIEADR